MGLSGVAAGRDGGEEGARRSGRSGVKYLSFARVRGG